MSDTPENMLSMPPADDLKAVVSAACNVATAAVSDHPQQTKDAIGALAGGLTAVADHVVMAANPIAGELLTLASPSIVYAITEALTALFVKIGVSVPHGLADLHSQAAGLLAKQS